MKRPSKVPNRLTGNGTRKTRTGKKPGPLYYVSESSETGQQFLVQVSKDGFIIELTPESVRLIKALRYCKRPKHEANS
jgi:hypothetical protein